jgi:hypothetical protein
MHGRSGKIWLIALGCALSGSLFGAAAFGSAPGRTVATPSGSTSSGTISTGPDVAPPPHPSRSPVASAPGNPPPTGQASPPSPTSPVASPVIPKNHVSKRAAPVAPRHSERPQAWQGAEVPFAAPSPTPAPSWPASALGRLAVRSHQPARGDLPGLLIYSGMGALAIAMGGMLVLGLQRRRW